MKARKRKPAAILQKPRTVNLHALFTPEGPDAADTLAFLDFCQAATIRSQESKYKQLAQREAEIVERKARQVELETASRKVMPILAKAQNNKISAEAAARKIKRLVPDKALLRELFEVLSEAATATPEQVAKQSRDGAWRKAKLARDEVRLSRYGKLLKARGEILDGLSTLANEATAGDADAAKGLAEVATQATGLLLVVEKARAGLLRPVARGQMHWPVLASDEVGWENGAVQRVAALGLGADLLALKVRFRKARGTDANLPARRWAKAAVRAIEETRCRFLNYGRLLQDFGSIEALADFCLEAGWEFSKNPSWVSDVARLEPFSKDSLPDWKRVIRQMIREQLHDFHRRLEWSTQCNTAKASGRETPGEIQNAILDDICSALERIAPSKELPNSAC